MTKQKVVSLSGGPLNTNEPNPRIVQAAKEILSAAEDGRLVSFAATGFMNDGLCLSCLIPHDNAYEIIGSLEKLKLRFIDEMTEQL